MEDLIPQCPAAPDPCQLELFGSTLSDVKGLTSPVTEEGAPAPEQNSRSPTSCFALTVDQIDRARKLTKMSRKLKLIHAEHQTETDQP